MRFSGGFNWDRYRTCFSFLFYQLGGFVEAQINLSTIISTIVLLAGYLWGYLRAKAINEAKWEVVASEISGMKKQLEKMNGNVCKHQDWIIHHLEDCHKEK